MGQRSLDHLTLRSETELVNHLATRREEAEAERGNQQILGLELNNIPRTVTTTVTCSIMSKQTIIAATGKHHTASIIFSHGLGDTAGQFQFHSLSLYSLSSTITHS